MGESADEWAAKDLKNIWGMTPIVREMRSEGHCRVEQWEQKVLDIRVSLRGTGTFPGESLLVAV